MTKILAKSHLILGYQVGSRSSAPNLLDLPLDLDIDRHSMNMFGAQFLQSAETKFVYIFKLGIILKVFY